MICPCWNKCELFKFKTNQIPNPGLSQRRRMLFQIYWPLNAGETTSRLCTGVVNVNQAVAQKMFSQKRVKEKPRKWRKPTINPFIILHRYAFHCYFYPRTKVILKILILQILWRDSNDITKLISMLFNKYHFTMMNRRRGRESKMSVLSCDPEMCQSKTRSVRVKSLFVKTRSTQIRP